MKHRFNRLYSPIHADEALIQCTLEAAKQRESRRTRAPWLLVPAVAAMLCIVIATVFLRNGTPEDAIAANGELPGTGEAFLPIESPDPDSLSIIADAEVISDTEIRVLVTLSGALVDPLTTIDVTYPHTVFGAVGYYRLEQQPGQPDNECRYELLLTMPDAQALADLGDTLDLSLCSYTSGNRWEEVVHEDLVWDDLEFVQQEPGRRPHTRLPAGESLYHIGEGFDISNFGFAEDGRFIVQIRMSDQLLPGSYIRPALVPATSPENEATYCYANTTEDTTIGQNWYQEYLFPVSLAKLNRYQLKTYVLYIGEIFYGNWSVTVDLNPEYSD